MGKFVSPKSELNFFSIVSFYYAVARWRYSFYVISDSKTADQGSLSANSRVLSREMVFSSNARMIIKEVVSIMADVKETVFFSDGDTIQFKNRYLIEYLMMMEVNDLGISWTHFASSHGKVVVDGVGGTLKRLMFGALQLKSSSTHVTGKRQQRLFNSYNKLNSMGKKYHLSLLFRRLYVYQIFSNIIMWMTGIGML